MGGQGVQQLDLGDRQPGVAEQRQPGRQVHRCAAQPGQSLLVTAVRRVRRDPLDNRPPQFGLPAEVVIELSAIPSVARPSTSRAGVGGVAWRRTRTGRRSGARRRSAGPCRSSASSPSGSSSKWPRWVASVRHQVSSRLASMTSSSGHTIASGDHGSSSAVPVISAIRERRLTKGHPRAHAVHRRHRAPGRARAAGSATARRRAPAPGPVPRRTGREAGREQGAEPVGEQVGPGGRWRCSAIGQSP